MNITYREIESWTRQLATVTRGAKLKPDLLVTLNNPGEVLCGAMYLFNFPQTPMCYTNTLPEKLNPDLFKCVIIFSSKATEEIQNVYMEAKGRYVDQVVQWVSIYTSKNSPTVDLWLMVIPEGEDIIYPWNRP